MPIVYINIGSNLGQRETLIQKAIDEISNHFGCCCVSGLVESEPWGFDSTNPFLNIGLAFKTNEAPERILDFLQGVERKLSSVSHRDKKGNYKDREIDIDIMAIDQSRIKTERLIVPHPHLRERDFFLIPLMELAPDWQYPVSDFCVRGSK